jgi:hypothetical protein
LRDLAEDVDEVVEQKRAFEFEPSFVKLKSFGRWCLNLPEELMYDSAEDILKGILPVMLKEKVGYKSFKVAVFYVVEDYCTVRSLALHHQN